MANPTNKTKDSFVPKEVDVKTVNVFFDGTKNNMFNTDTYKGFSKKEKEDHNKDETSYTNAYTNIAWMFRKGNTENGQKWVYIEGIGTLTGDTNDELSGYAFGTGDTGVVERAKEAFGAIENEVGAAPSVLHINIFGFSRGAATARHFIHLAKSSTRPFPNWRLSSTKILFKFVGLFDTVSSYDKSMSAWPNFDNDQDADELTLNFSDLSATDRAFTKVFHIIAADEYRENFSVTNINSAVGSGFGYEVTMNGAHADIGGAYNNNSSDTYSTTSKTQKSWLLEKNFYNSKEMKIDRGGRDQPSTYKFARKGIKNDIHKISLQMMAKMSGKYGQLSFLTGRQGLTNYYNATTGDVKKLMTNLPNEVINADPWKNGAKRGRRITKTLPENAATKSLRHNYIHWSVRNKIGFGVRLKNGIPYRQPING